MYVVDRCTYHGLCKGGFAPLAKFANIVYTKEKWGYKICKSQVQRGNSVRGYLHLSRDKDLYLFVIAVALVF